jgi:hypothetical protein
VNYRFVNHHSGKRVAVETLDTGIGPKPKRGRFVKFPLVWFDRLGEINASGSTYRVAIHILQRAWQRRSSTIKLPNVNRVSRNGRRAALQQLERAGLITVDRQPKRSPVVTVLLTD